MSLRFVSQHCHSKKEGGIYCTKKIYSKATKRKRCVLFYLFNLSITTYLLFIVEEFDNYMQQDAHEFLNFLINHISEIILCKWIIAYKCQVFSNCCFVAERQQNNITNNIKSKGNGENGTTHSPPEPTWVHEIFQVKDIHRPWFCSKNH